jgi:hypothetical protein
MLSVWSEGEGPWPFESGKRFDVGVGDAAQANDAIGAASDSQSGHAAIDNGAGNAAIGRELLGE